MSTQQKTSAKYETSPERVEGIRDTIEALCEERGASDTFDGEEKLRALAARLRLPYLALQVTPLGTAGLTERDVDDYNAWRATLGNGGKEVR